MAASRFTSLDSQVVRFFPAVILTGVAPEGFPGVPRRLVEIISTNDAYWVKVQLPISRQADLVYAKYGLEHETRMRLMGAMCGAETTVTATTPDVLGRRAQSQPVYPLRQFTMSFDLPGPVSLEIRYNKLCDNGTFEIFLLKAYMFEGETPLASPSEEATQPSTAPSEGAPPAPSQTAEEAATPHPAPTSSA